MLKAKKEDPQHSISEDPHWPRELEPRLERVQKASLDVKVVLGRTELTLSQLSDLQEGSIVETRALSGMPLEILVNGTLFGRGEIIVIGDNMAVRVTDLVKPEAMVNG